MLKQSSYCCLHANGIQKDSEDLFYLCTKILSILLKLTLDIVQQCCCISGCSIDIMDAVLSQWLL